MHEAGRMPHPSEPPARYLFIVARNRPDMLEQVKERLRGDNRIEVIADRRYGERRRSAVPREPDRRGVDRRRPTTVRDDLSVYPTLVAQRHVESYAELQQKVVAAVRESQELREENDRLRADLSSLKDQLEALLSADAAFKADALAQLMQAEDAVAALMARFRALTSEWPPTLDAR
jgi:regulator of replication initiation timing